MRRNMLAARHAFPLMAALLILTLSACQSEEGEPTPGASVSPLYTAAAQTLSAQQVTKVPLILPTPVGAVVPNTGATLVVPVMPVVPNTGATVVVPMGPVTGGGTVATAQPGACENATFLGDVTVPDGTVVAPGQTFVKTWALENTGTCPWTSADKLVLVDGAPMGSSEAALAGAVAAGQTANLSISLTAPVTPGSYTATWRLKDPAGNYFGDVVTISITVSSAGDSP